MNVLIAPNAFKGTIEADEAAEIIAEGIKKKYPQANLKLCPIADGGDGTCYLLGKALGLQKFDLVCLNPIGRPVKGFFFFNPSTKTALIDVSTVSGIKYLKETEKQAWLASSFGTGELVKAAVAQGAEHIVLGLGGSASIDLGLGILGGLGYVFLDEHGRQIPFFSERFISKIAHIQAPIVNYKIRFTILCDVENTFFGQNGAIPVFGPQKGLNQTEIPNYLKASEYVLKLLGKKAGVVVQDKKGFGAAGGIAFGLSFFFPIQIKMGANWFFNELKIDSLVKWSDVVITGEGKYDSQSEGGKGSFELLQLVKRLQKHCILITSGNDAVSAGFDQLVKLQPLDFSQNDFLDNAKSNLEEAVSTIKLV
jgi:glycerate kinase